MISHQQPHSGDCAFRWARSVALFNFPELANAPAQADKSPLPERGHGISRLPPPKGSAVILAETVSLLG